MEGNGNQQSLDTHAMESKGLKDSAKDLLVGGFAVLRTKGVLPRPRVRYLEMGRDYYLGDLRELPQFTTLAQRIANDPRISQIHSQHVRGRGDFFEPYVLTLFERVLNDSGGSDIDEATFDKWFSKLEAELLSPTMTFVDIWALGRLEMEVRNIQIDKNTNIRRFALNELSEMLEANIGIEGWAWDKNLYWQNLCGLMVTHKHNKADMMYLSFPRGPVDKLLLILRSMHLHKEGDVLPTKWIAFHESDFPLTHPMIFDMQHVPSGLDPTYHLLENDAEAIGYLSEDLDWLSKIAPEEDSTARKLRLALSFFESSYDMKPGIESLVDLCIALEALFLSGRDELSYRLAHRVAALLGTDDEESRELFKRVRALYNLRSDYVHGKPLSADDELESLAEITNIEPSGLETTWGPAIREIQDCVRRSLKPMIRLNRQGVLKLDKGFYNKIDQFLFDKEAQKQFQEMIGLVSS